eukprot:Nk52_evm8s179 gene=Nk52_evmTU8s179
MNSSNEYDMPTLAPQTEKKTKDAGEYPNEKIVQCEVDMELGDPLDTSEGQASIFSGIFNLSNTILGAGILSIPYAYSLTGFYLGLCLLIIFAVGANFGLKLLVEVARWTKKRQTSYFVLAQHTFPWARYVIDAAVAFKCFGVATSYLIVVGDNMSMAVGHWAGSEDDTIADRRIWIAIFMIFCIPAALQKTLDKLRFVSLVAISTVFYLCIVVIYFYITNNDPKNRGEFKEINLSIDIIQALPVLVFSYTCHQNVFAVYSEMKNNTTRRVHTAINASIIGCTAMYLIVGIMGYLTYYDNVEGNLLSSYPAGNEIVNSCRLLVAVLGAVSYPLQIHPARISLDNLLWGHKKYNGEDKSASLRYWLESAFLIGGTFTVSMIVRDLGVVFGVIGSTGSTTLCYLLPGLFYLKMTSLKGESGFTIKKAIGCIMVLFGCFMLVAGNYVTISNYIKDE